LQEQHVGAQRLGGGALGRGANDVAALLIAAVREQVGDELAQALPLGFVVDARRHADAVTLGQVHEKARRDRDVRREARTFGPERILQHLDEDLAALGDQLVDVLGARAFEAVLVERRRRDVGGVEERGAFQADLDEAACMPGSTRETLPL
jgi:hypothetical protein